MNKNFIKIAVDYFVLLFSSIGLTGVHGVPLTSELHSLSFKSPVWLRMVPTFVTAQTFLRYLGFLWMVPANTGIFLCGLKLCVESRTYQVLLISIKKIGGSHGFFRDN